MMNKLLNSKTPRQTHGGFTLMEFLVASAMSVIIISSLVATTIFVLRSFTAIGNYTDLDRSSRNTLDQMSRDIRDSSGLSMTSYMTNNITLTNSDGSSFSYQWDPSDQTLRRYYTNASGISTVTVMLTNCDILTFFLYLRYPTNDLTFSFVPSTNSPNETKLVNVDWRCSRKIYGAKINTESIQTAQITIRN